MSLKFVQVINFIMPTIVGILNFMTRKMTFSIDLSKKFASFVSILILLRFLNFMLM